MTRRCCLLLTLLLTACGPTPPAAPGASASPSTSPSAAPSASAAPSSGPSTDPREIVPGTLRDAVPITGTLKVDGQPATMDMVAAYHNSAGSAGSLFWDMGVYARHQNTRPAGVLKLGQFAITVHVQAATADPEFFRKSRTLTDAEYQTCVKLTMLEGVMFNGVLTTREWYGDARTPGGIGGKLTVEGETTSFSFKGTLPADKLNGKPHEVDLAVSGLPRP